METQTQKQARRSFGKPYDCLKPWPEDCGVQCGDSGIVLGGKGSLGKVLGGEDPLKELSEAAAHEETYTTAFFEAFPKNPSCFIRGEGKTIEEAEEKAYQKWLGILNCPGHEFEARGRKDGYGYCKHCTLSKSGVLPILNKCCKCKVPTNWMSDTKGNIYCKKHAQNIPKKYLSRWLQEKRTPRKIKKLYKKAFAILLTREGKSFKKIKMQGKYAEVLVADSKWQLAIPFRRRKLIEIARRKIS